MCRWYGALISISGWETGRRRVSDFNAALAIPNLTDIEKKNIRLIAADAALASGDFRAALELLAGYSRTDPAVVTRLGDADGAAEKKATLKGDGKLMPMPAQTAAIRPMARCAAWRRRWSRALPFRSSPSTRRPRVSKPQARPIRPAGTRITLWPSKRRERPSRPARTTIANRLLLVNLMISAGRPADAEAEASKAINAGRRHRRNLRPARLCAEPPA